MSESRIPTDEADSADNGPCRREIPLPIRVARSRLGNPSYRSIKGEACIIIVRIRD